MTFKHYFIFMGVGTLLAFVSWLIVFMVIDPLTAGITSKIAFFLTFFISTIGFLTMVGTAVRVFLIERDGVVSKQASQSFRQALFFSSILLAAMILAAVDLLRWWTIALVILFFGFFEAFLQTSKHRS